MSAILIALGVVFLLFHLAVLIVFISNTGGLSEYTNPKNLPIALLLCTPVIGTFLMCLWMFTYFVIASSGTLR